MDKETLSNYGWIVICVLVLAVMIALATPFGTFVADAIKSTTQGLFDVNQNALNSTGLINIGDQSFGDGGNGGTGDQGGINTLPEVGKTAEEYTWAEIKAISEAGKGDEYFNLGDTKTFTTTDGKEIVMEIVAFNADTKAGGTGKAGITWMSLSIITTYAMNSSDSNSDGWGGSDLRSWLQNDFHATLPLDVKSSIVDVNKTYYDYSTTSTKSCIDNVWIPSVGEIFGNNYDVNGTEDNGAEYTSHFNTVGSRMKYYNGSIDITWLRSASIAGPNYFRGLTNRSGSTANYCKATTSYGVVLGFCT